MHDAKWQWSFKQGDISVTQSNKYNCLGLFFYIITATCLDGGYLNVSSQMDPINVKLTVALNHAYRNKMF